MNSFEQNKSFNLGLVPKQLRIVNHFDYGITIDESEHILIPKILYFSHELQCTIVSIWWVCLVIGSYFRCVLYSFLYQKYKEKSLKTIDRLCLVIALIQHFFIGWATFDTTLRVINNKWLSESALGYGACRFANFYYKFSESYACIGSLGLAFYRLLYIRMGTFVKHVVGEETMANIILFTGLGSSAWMILFPRLLKQDWSHLEWEPCLNTPKISHALEFLEDYEQSLGRSPSLTNMKYTYLGTRLTYLLATWTELCLYISFFHYMYKQNNCDRLKRLLEPVIIRQRNRRSAISFFGQFCSFAMEFIGNVLFVVAIANSAPKKEDEQNDFFIFAFCSVPVTFAAISFIEVIVSSMLRAKILEF